MLCSFPDFQRTLPRGGNAVADYCDVPATESSVDLSGLRNIELKLVHLRLARGQLSRPTKEPVRLTVIAFTIRRDGWIERINRLKAR